MIISLPLGTVEAVMLAGVRIAAFLVIAPPFAHRAVPGTVKAMLAVGLALLLGPRVGTSGISVDDTGGYLLALGSQVLIGGGLGFIVALTFSAVQSAGGLIDLFGGFQLAAAFDPINLTNGAQFFRLYELTAIVLLFVSDGYQLMIAGLVRSFDAIPLGATLNLASMGQGVTEGLTQMFLAALQIAGPLIVVLFLADVGLGLLTRVAPALNVFALGFPLKILLTLSLGSLAYLALPRIVASLSDGAARGLLGVTG